MKTQEETFEYNLLKNVLGIHVKRLKDCEKLHDWVRDNLKDSLELTRLGWEITSARVEAEEIMEEVLREK